MSNQDYGEQLRLDLQVITSNEVDGVGMGVLSDETPFLTGRGLAHFCGISNSTLVEWGEFTPERGSRFRAGKMAELLAANGFEGARFFEKIPLSGSAFGGSGEVSIYPDRVCMAFLEYYAFEAGKWCTDKAKDNFRALARKSLKDFIYQMTGYKPSDANDVAALSWKNLQARLLLNTIPATHFSVLEEAYNLELKIIRGGLRLDHHTVPDISIGSTWANHWKANNLEEKYGNRIKYPHVYPPSYAQSKANGKIDYWIYPLEAISHFKAWLQTEYVTQKLPKYMKDQVKKGLLIESRAQAILKAVTPTALSPGSQRLGSA